MTYRITTQVCMSIDRATLQQWEMRATSEATLRMLATAEIEAAGRRIVSIRRVK